jgi:hypothetical protein
MLTSDPALQAVFALLPGLHTIASLGLTAAEVIPARVGSWSLLLRQIAVSDATTNEGVGLAIIAQCSHGDTCIVVASGDHTRRVETPATCTYYLCK